MRIFLLLAGLSVLTATNAQQDDSLFIRKLADEVLINGKAYDNLRELTKTIGARLAGSSGMVKAEVWGLKKMKEAGDSKAWMQECMVPHWVRGGTDAAVVVGTTEKRKLDVLALGNSIGTGLKGLTADVVEINSFEELESKKDAVKGKIVFINYKFNPTFVQTFYSYIDAVKYRAIGPSRVAKFGGAALILRSMTHSTDNFPHTGSLRYDSTLPMIPAVAVGLKDADWLSTRLKTGKSLKIDLRTNGKFLPDTIGHNIIGEIKGSEFPNEFITVGGHLDSWDVGEGAHDDGTGIAQTIEILRAFTALGLKPKHSIRFVLFANEENGTRGGNKYAEEAKAKNEKHILALESDGGGFTPRGIGFTVTPAQYQKILNYKKLLAPYGGGDFEPEGEGTDIEPLNRVLGTALAGLMTDSQRYFDIHHTRNDVFENVNKRELELGAINMAAIIYLIDKYGL